MTKLCGIVAFAFLFAFAHVGYAADANQSVPAEKPFLPSVDMNGYLQGYSLELNTDPPNQTNFTIPQALSPLRDNDEMKVFLGLKLTTPLESK